jgi:transposase, IS30 family
MSAFERRIQPISAREGDLLTGANYTHIATLVERNTRFTMLVKIPRKDTTTVVAALAKHIGKLPEELRRSLTWDQGKEMHAHKRFTVATNVQVYFCDPRSPWQRGSNENTNGLLRQYFPRGTDFSRISQSYLNAIALRLNQRPRRPWASKRQPIDYKRCCTDRFVVEHNDEPKPFTWTADPDKIIQAVRRGHQVLDSIH